MTRRRIVKIFVVTIVAFVALVTAGAIYLSHTNRESAISTATAWARLAPLPPSAQNVQVDVKGGMMSREFVITFNAPPATIQQWIAASAGPSSAKQSTSGTITTYAITPSGGAQFAQVKVDSSSNRVVIHTYWS